jgi:hypothetical protein
VSRKDGILRFNRAKTKTSKQSVPILVSFQLQKALCFDNNASTNTFGPSMIEIFKGTLLREKLLYLRESENIFRLSDGPSKISERPFKSCDSLYP